MLTVRQRYVQTDGRTDRRLTIAIPRFALRASRGKNDAAVSEIIWLETTEPWKDDDSHSGCAGYVDL